MLPKNTIVAIEYVNIIVSNVLDILLIVLRLTIGSNLPPQIPLNNLLHLGLNSHRLNSHCEVLKYHDMKQLNSSFSFFFFNTKLALLSLIHTKDPGYLYKNFHLFNTSCIYSHQPFSHITFHRISSHALAQAHLFNLTSGYLSPITSPLTKPHANSLLY